MKAAVYVGTYHKYNNGSISGKWLNLADYTTKRAFYNACKDLHKDEHDPEYMFQDYENVPSSMISESSINDEVWHVINSIRKFAPDRADEFAEWCEDNGAECDYSALREFMGYGEKKARTTDKKATKKADLGVQMSKEDIIKAIEIAFTDKWHRDYHAGITSNAAYMRGNVILLNKPSIETSFCFDDENQDQIALCSDFHNNGKRAQNHFLHYNMRRCNELKDLDFFLDDKDESKPYRMQHAHLYMYRLGDQGEYKISALDASGLEDMHRYYPHTEFIQLTESETEQYHKLLLNEKSKFENRLNTYLKRYGVSRCKAWTYWVNA